VNEHSEISDLLWDFVKDDGDRCGNSDFYIYDEGDSDNDPIDEIMHHISHEIHPSEWVLMLSSDGEMAVISMDDFFCDESDQDSSNDS